MVNLPGALAAKFSSMAGRYLTSLGATEIGSVRHACSRSFGDSFRRTLIPGGAGVYAARGLVARGHLMLCRCAIITASAGAGTNTLPGGCAKETAGRPALA